MGRLDIELRYFEEHRQEWFRSDPCRFVLIYGTTLYGFYDTWRDASQVAAENIQPDGNYCACLIKQVLLVDEVLLMDNL